MASSHDPAMEAGLAEGGAAEYLARDYDRAEDEILSESGNTTPDGEETGVRQYDQHAEKVTHGPEVYHDASGVPQSSISVLGPLNDTGRRVSVSRGKQEFAALERKYSTLSQQSSERGHGLQRTTTGMSIASVRSAFGGKPQRTATRQSTVTEGTAAAAGDAEKGQAAAEDFNLAEELRAGRRKMDNSLIHHKNVGVVWEDLEIIGAGGMKMHIRNFSNAIMEQFMMPAIKVMGLVGYNPFAPKPKTILHASSGVLKPGEMCLVLGRPGAGCSTFLKSIANQREGFLEVNGDVEYAGIPAKEMHKKYGGEVSCADDAAGRRIRPRWIPLADTSDALQPGG